MATSLTPHKAIVVYTWSLNNLSICNHDLPLILHQSRANIGCSLPTRRFLHEQRGVASGLRKPKSRENLMWLFRVNDEVMKTRLSHSLSPLYLGTTSSALVFSCPLQSTPSVTALTGRLDPRNHHTTRGAVLSGGTPT